MNTPATIQGAVEKRNAAPAKPSLAQTIRTVVERQTPAMAAVLPAGFDPDRFSRLVITSVKQTPRLMECFATEQGTMSVMLAAMQLATVGLEPNTATQEAWLTPRKNKGVWECQATIGYRGMLKLSRRSGEVKECYAEVVREGDEFEYARELHKDTLKHKAVGENEDAPLTHAYAVVRYVNGGVDFMVLTRKDVERRRAMSDSYRSESSRPYSPWVQQEDDMWRKSALRALAKRMPMSAEAARAVNTDERSLSLDEDSGIIPAVHTVDPDDALDAIEAGEANILPPRWLRPYIEQAWIDSFDLDDLDDRQSAGMSVAEEGGWVHRFHGQEDDAGNPIPCLLCDEDWTPDDDDDDG
jgi:recombination protein RecT